MVKVQFVCFSSNVVNLVDYTVYKSLYYTINIIRYLIKTV